MIAISEEVTAFLDEHGRGLQTKNYRYYKVEKIHRGNYGQVTVYRDSNGARVVAKGWLRSMMDNKRVPRFDPDATPLMPLREQVWKEVRILQQVANAAHFPLLQEIVNDPNYKRLLVVMEYLEPLMFWQDLTHAYSATQDELTVYSCDVAVEMARQLHDAVRYLHGLEVTHNDVKPDNCGLTGVVPKEYLLAADAQSSPTKFPSSICLKVFDFSSASEALTVHGAECTVEFMPPEAIVSSPTWGPGRDLWATGMVLFAMLFGVSAYGDECSDACHREIKIANVDWKIPACGLRRVEKHEAMAILKRLLHHDPKQRKW